MRFLASAASLTDRCNFASVLPPSQSGISRVFNVDIWSLVGVGVGVEALLASHVAWFFGVHCGWKGQAVEDFEVKARAQGLHVLHQDPSFALPLLHLADLLQVLEQEVVLGVDKVSPHELDEFVAEELDAGPFGVLAEDIAEIHEEARHALFHRGQLLERLLDLLGGGGQRDHDDGVLVRLVVKDVVRGTDFLKEGLGLGLECLGQIRISTLADVMNRECLADLSAIEVPELPEEGLPQGVLLDARLVQVIPRKGLLGLFRTLLHLGAYFLTFGIFIVTWDCCGRISGCLEIQEIRDSRVGLAVSFDLPCLHGGDGSLGIVPPRSLQWHGGWALDRLAEDGLVQLLRLSQEDLRDCQLLLLQSHQCVIHN